MELSSTLASILEHSPPEFVTLARGDEESVLSETQESGSFSLRKCRAAMDMVVLPPLVSRERVESWDNVIL